MMNDQPDYSITREQIEEAKGLSPWHLTNETLYNLCREHPTHTDKQAVLAKMNIIGRVYAAAIERRKRKSELAEEKNEAFYISRVAPTIMGSDMDQWLNRARSTDPSSLTAFRTMIEIHKRTTDLFSEISHQNKRSLASKYLHFHVPSLFFIYDSRAKKGIGSLSLPKLKRERASEYCDRDYRAFAAKCIALRDHCRACFGIELSPRELDNLLLAVSR